MQNTEPKQKEFDLHDRLIAIKQIKIAREELTALLKQMKWMKTHLEGSINALNAEIARLESEINKALEEKRITFADIDRVSCY